VPAVVAVAARGSLGCAGAQTCIGRSHKFVGWDLAVVAADFWVARGGWGGGFLGGTGRSGAAEMSRDLASGRSTLDEETGWGNRRGSAVTEDGGVGEGERRGKSRGRSSAGAGRRRSSGCGRAGRACAGGWG
jgi:hypothetical protein